jgi:hypothetical protein
MLRFLLEIVWYVCERGERGRERRRREGGEGERERRKRGRGEGERRFINHFPLNRKTQI